MTFKKLLQAIDQSWHGVVTQLSLKDNQTGFLGRKRK